MRTIVDTIRSNDQRHHAEKAEKAISTHLLSVGDDLPSYESLFPNPISAKPNPEVTPSLYGQTSETSDESVPDSLSSKSCQMDLGAKYQPSMWYYEPGENPIVYEAGKKVSNPFTAPLRALQTDGDRKKLKGIVTRIDFI